MNVVSYNQASIRAGVSRQRITKLKRDHNEKKSVKSYFVFDPKGGKEGINIDDPSWKRYEGKTNKKRVNKNKIKDTEDSKQDNEVNSELVNKKTFALAVILSIKETLDISGADLKKLSKVISLKYEEMEKG